MLGERCDRTCAAPAPRPAGPDDRKAPSFSRREPTTAVLDLDSARHVVTAVIVSHDGARWLPETMDALRAQSRPVQRAVAADTGSTDGGTDILRAFLPPDAIVGLPADTGYGDAVRAALDLPRSTSPVHGFHEDATEWIWLIHDDLAPGEDALAHLLAAADQDPRAAVLGPKLRDWFDRRLLIEAGVTIDGAGHRETGLEPREFDHGQHDGTRRVLAVSSAGMLIRRDVWDRLGGFDRALPLFRDDIDLCWRVGGAGLHVLIVTEAVAHHAEASARRRRPIGATRGHPRRVDRRHAVFVLLANLPFGGMVTALLRNSIGSLLRVTMYLLMKQPANAFDEAAAITLVYLRPDILLRARFRRRRDRRRTYSAIRPYLARGVAMRQFTDFITGVLSGEPVIGTGGRHQAVTAPAPEDEETPTDTGGFLRRAVLRPGPILVIVLTAVALVAERSLLWGPLLAGGALPPVTGSAADLWNLYLSSAPDSGLGSGSAVPPHVGILALLSTITLGKPWIAVSVLLLGSVPLAGATAYLLAREVLGYRPARVWMAASYALLPVATGAIAQGRLGTAVVHVLMPVLGLLLIRVVSMPAKYSRRAAWGLGLVLAAATAFVPLVWPLALVTGLLVAAVFGHLGRRLYSSIGISLGVPLVMLMPWTLDLLLHPAQWLLEAGLHRPELSEPPATPEQLLMLSPGGPGAPPAWVTAGLSAAALCALLLLRNRLLVAAGWSLAVFGLLIAVLTSILVVEPHFGGPPAAVWPGAPLTFAATAVLLSAATAARAFRGMLSLGGLRRVFAAGAALLAVTTPLAGAALWMWEGADGPLTSHAAPLLPATPAGDDGTRPRTLVITPDGAGGVGYVVARGREPGLGEERIRPDETARETVDLAVAELAVGQGGERLRALADYGIRYVLYPRPETGTRADVTMVDMLDGTPGLVRESLSDRYGLWRSAELAGRLRVVSADGTEAEPLTVSGPGHDFTAQVGDGGPGRLLALAETAGDGWRATVDGAELVPAEERNGTQTWELPARGGEIRVWYTDHVHTAWVVAQGTLLLIVAVLAAPGVRTEEDARLIESTAAPRPRRPAGFSRRGSRARGGPVTGAAGTPGAGADGGAQGTGGEATTPDTGEFAVTDTGPITAVRRRGTRRKGRRRSGSARGGTGTGPGDVRGE